MTLRITIADDDREMLLITEHTLQRAFPNARLVSFQAPRAAFEHIQTQGTDFIVTNHGMSVMSGTDLTKILRAHVRVPIIMISNNPDVRSEAIEAGADHFVDKAHIDRLPAVVRSYLARATDT
jgi:DNA-binding response OmpR family regulator